jgi:hypothetical protein
MATPKQSPDIWISYEETIPGAAIQRFADAVSAPGLALEVETRPSSGPQAALIWLAATAVIIYLGKPYFEGFLKEAGKDHYQLLKKGISSLWSSFFGDARAVRMTIVGSRGKLPKALKYSVAFSIMAEANSGLRFKLLFPDDISAEEFDLAVANFLAFLSRYYSGDIDSGTQHRLASYRAMGHTILLTYDNAND